MEILGIKKNRLNFSSIVKGGVYVDNAQNRKLGRVGQPYKKENKVEKEKEDDKDQKISSILKESKVLGKAEGARLDAIISYAEFDCPKGLSDEDKRKFIADSYIKSAELKGSDKEIANSLDEIVEEALADYVSPKEKKDNANNPFK